MAAVGVATRGRLQAIRGLELRERSRLHGGQRRVVDRLLLRLLLATAAAMRHGRQGRELADAHAASATCATGRARTGSASPSRARSTGASRASPCSTTAGQRTTAENRTRDKRVGGHVLAVVFERRVVLQPFTD